MCWVRDLANILNGHCNLQLCLYLFENGPPGLLLRFNSLTETPMAKIRQRHSTVTLDLEREGVVHGSEALAVSFSLMRLGCMGVCATKRHAA